MNADWEFRFNHRLDFKGGPFKMQFSYSMPSSMGLVLLALKLHLSLTSGSPTTSMSRRDDATTYCVQDVVDGTKTVGNLLCVQPFDAAPYTLTCEECVYDYGGSGPARTDGGVQCSITTGDGSPGNITVSPSPKSSRKLKPILI